MCLAGLAGTAVAGAAGGRAESERLGEAAVLFGAVESGLAALKAELDIADRVVYDQQLAVLKTKLAPEVLAEGWQKGAAMGLEEMVQLGLSFTGWGTRIQQVT
jgi:hypothetical protein